MSNTYIPRSLRLSVAERSGYRCSYCQTAQELTGAEFTIGHIVPESLGGATTGDNLCLSCWLCNAVKNDRIAGIDPESGLMTPLYNPYTQRWTEYFYWVEDGLSIVGLTPTGRATVNAIKLNRPSLVISRRLWVGAGWHPPRDEA
jgi:hypothetical protein